MVEEYYNDDGKRHRENGPTVIYSTGDQEWWLNGELHRENGPAIINQNGKEKWYFINGWLHREDGPAIIWPSGSEEWWVNNQDITREVKNWMKKQKIMLPFDEEERALFLLTFNS